jgi:hypothetical protein
MPLNALDATFRSFEKQVLPEAKKCSGRYELLKTDEADGNVGPEQHHYPSTEKLAV